MCCAVIIIITASTRFFCKRLCTKVIGCSTVKNIYLWLDPSELHFLMFALCTLQQSERALVESMIEWLRRASSNLPQYFFVKSIDPFIVDWICSNQCWNYNQCLCVCKVFKAIRKCEFRKTYKKRSLTLDVVVSILLHYDKKLNFYFGWIWTLRGFHLLRG